jgi:RNA polymerase sigma factor (TIGR02999 family)
MDTPITDLLLHAADGNRHALDEVFRALYPDLRRVAHARLYAHGRAHGLGTTALVHESFIRLVNARQVRVEDRHHFFTYAAKTMRNLIVDELRAGHAERRGGGVAALSLGADDEMPLAAPAPGDEALAVHEELRELERLEPELAEVVEMRYFGGYSDVEIAELLGVTERTVRRRWDKARAALYLALKGSPRAE